MKQVIARIKLNPGQGGFFDPVTRIHLTHGDPVKDVYAGMNTEGLKAAVRSKRISLISGSLGNNVAPFKFVRRQDGKIVIMPNKVQDTSKQEETAAPKAKTKTVNVPKKPKSALKIQSSLPAEPVEKPVTEAPPVIPEVPEIPVIPAEPVISEVPVVPETVAAPEEPEPSVTIVQDNNNVTEIPVDIIPESVDIAVPVDVTEEQQDDIVTSDSSSTDNIPYKRYKKNKKKYNDN